MGWVVERGKREQVGCASARSSHHAKSWCGQGVAVIAWRSPPAPSRTCPRTVWEVWREVSHIQICGLTVSKTNFPPNFPPNFPQGCGPDFAPNSPPNFPPNSPPNFPPNFPPLVGGPCGCEGLRIPLASIRTSLVTKGDCRLVLALSRISAGSPLDAQRQIHGFACSAASCSGGLVAQREPNLSYLTSLAHGPMGERASTVGRRAAAFDWQSPPERTFLVGGGMR